MTTFQVRLTDILAPDFHKLHRDLVKGAHSYFKLSGGRGSTKSSFVSVEIILGMMRDGQQGRHTGAVAVRRYKENLHGSVYEQLVWAIHKLGVERLWKQTTSPPRLTFRPTGQSVFFHGADKAQRFQSVKVSKGYIKYLWFEELDEFEGMESIRSMQQSVVRGGDTFRVFYTYNPPRSQHSWVNNEAFDSIPGMVSHHSSYRTVPPQWLGRDFLAAAEHLREVNPKAYRHEYLGEVTGTGTEVFANLTSRRITDQEIAWFDNLHRGIDWGYASDPFHYTVNHYDSTRKRLYIFYELHQTHLSGQAAAALVKAENAGNALVVADSADPRSIDELRDEGIRIAGACKGRGSVERGVKWLSEELEEIIIDRERCPNTWREFYGYERESDRNGNPAARYPDKDNHSIDATRYSLENVIRERWGALRET